MKQWAWLALALLASPKPNLSAQSPTTTVLRIPATANPYLAGFPGGARVQWNDSAPRQSPVLVPLSLIGAVSVTFAAAGAVFHLPGCPPQCDPPNGGAITEHRGGPENGIANIIAPYDSVVGLFLDDSSPDRSRAPKTLDFGRIGLNFTSLSPELKQIFFIGSGTTKQGVPRRYLVPKGATRLFLAVMDGFEWNNNTGSFRVAVSLERAEVSSNMYNVDSSISFANWACLPDRSHCTPGQEIVEERGPGQYHVLLPPQIEWGVSIPTPPGAVAAVSAAAGTVCLDFPSLGVDSCHGPQGNGTPAGAGFLVPDQAAGAVVTKTAEGRTYFSVNGRSGAFQNHQGYFEFDVIIR